MDSNRERREVELRREAELGQVAGFPPGARGTGDHRIERALQDATRQAARRGTREALAFDSSLVRYGNGTADCGYRCAAELMRVPDPPTAIFCGNDPTAMGAYEALKERGLRIPEDVAVVGFDNQELIAAHLRPALSTVALPHYEMGRWAVGHLIEQAEHGKATPTRHAIGCPYVERESV